jgi:acyl-CoA thioester hydrolase
MYKHSHKLRVRYGETDQMGYCYYGNYAQFFEIGRVETLRSLGMSYKEIEEKGYMLPVAELNTKYLKPSFYDDEINVVTTIKKTPSVKIEFDYEIFNEKGDLLTIGYTKLVFVNIKTMKPCPCPQELIDKFNNAN